MLHPSFYKTLQWCHKNDFKMLGHTRKCLKNIFYLIWKCPHHYPCPFTIILVYVPIENYKGATYWLIFYIEYDLLNSHSLETCQAH